MVMESCRLTARVLEIFEAASAGIELGTPPLD
jgi:hypothetical protein